MDPEWNPGEDDNEDAGDVDLDEEVACVTSEIEIDLEQRELTCQNNCYQTYKITLSI